MICLALEAGTAPSSAHLLLCHTPRAVPTSTAPHGGIQRGRPNPSIMGAMSRRHVLLVPWRGKKVGQLIGNTFFCTWKCGHVNARIAKPRASGRTPEKAAYHHPDTPQAWH